MFLQETFMTDVVFNAEQKAKLNNLFNEGIAVMTEIETQQGG